ncbi:MAG: prepilin-type N-terminal cleavage/methylation domain-containing protein [Candidatus Ozemobacteraceae bacterium]
MTFFPTNTSCTRKDIATPYPSQASAVRNGRRSLFGFPPPARYPNNSTGLTGPACSSHGIFRQASGFTLVEVLISLLVMGLAISGLLNLLRWGQARYESLSRSPVTRTAISDMRRAVRNAVATGRLPLEIRDGKLVGNDSTPATLRIASISVRPYDTQSLFVKLDLFEDHNHDGHIQQNEKLQSPVWCFRLRDQQ